MLERMPDPLSLAEILVVSEAGVDDVEPPAARLSGRALVDALARAGGLDYRSVIAGIRETAAAIERASLLGAAPLDAVVDELAALEVHERRLRELGAPDLRAEAPHDALVAELARCRREDDPASARIVELCAELARFA